METISNFDFENPDNDKPLPQRTDCSFTAHKFSVFRQEVSFLEDPHFFKCWKEVCQETAEYYTEKTSASIFWSAHVAHALFQNSYVPNCSYVELGVNYGFISRAIFKLNRKKRFFKYLFDTWNGIPEYQFSTDEPLGHYHNSRNYNRDVFSIISNLVSGYDDITLVRGEIPSSLHGYENLSPRFLHIDLNIEFPERRALEFFVPKMASGSIVLLDDYGHRGHSKQRLSHDAFFSALGKQPVQIPTGQAFVVI